MPLQDDELLARLRDGDEDAYLLIVKSLHPSMVRIAAIYVRDQRVAEDVAQETWLAVLSGLSRFEGRSSLKTWIMSILVNRARTQARRETRYVLSEDDPLDTSERSLPAEMFNPPGTPHEGHWKQPLPTWENVPEERMLSAEVRAIIHHAINRLPVQQREVITLRDLESWSAQEVCNALNLTDTNQRVLLHRARTAVRRALAEYFEETGEGVA